MVNWLTINELRRKLGIRKRSANVKSAKVVCLVDFGATHIGRVSFAVTNKRGSGDVSDWSLHAEELAVKRILRQNLMRFGWPTITVIRLRNDGSVANAKPCPGCKAFLEKVYATVYYSNAKGEIVRL